MIRAEHGLVTVAVTTDQLRWIADAPAGDARVALGILRSAARRAGRQSASTITDDHIEAAIPAAREEVRAKNLEALRHEQRIIYEILRDHDELALRELYLQDEERVEKPRTKRTVRSWLRKLAKYNLVEGTGSGPNRTYRVRDGAADSR